MINDPSSWRKTNIDRPWYQAATKLLPGDLESRNILELGCGNGEFVYELRNRGAVKITCADGSKKYVDGLKKRGFIARCLDLNLKLPFAKSSFDLIIGLEIIEHLEQADYFVKQIYKLLSKQGLLILSTPNFSWWGNRLRYFLGYPPHHEGYHLRYFNYYTLLNLLKENNLIIINTYSISPLPFINKLLISIGKKPLWLKISFLQNLLAWDLVILAIKK